MGRVNVTNIEYIYNIFEILFYFYLIIYTTFILVGNFVAIYNLFRNRQKKILENQMNHKYYFPVSIIVPAYNESQTILSTIDSLLKQNYENFEILVIDDGSSDDTAQKVIDTYMMERQHQPVRLQVKSEDINEVYQAKIDRRTIKLIRKNNGKSKADAVNAGINVSQYPYFVCMDADEILQADALKNSSRKLFEHDNVIAVGGILNISNGVEFENAWPVETKLPKNFVTAMQSLEYTRSFMGSRVFNDSFNGNLNVSGGYGLFQKQAVINVGGYDSKSVGEDMDLVMRLHKYYLSKKQSYKISYASDAVCWTQAPFSLKDLANQRSRWHRGLIQCMWNHRIFFLNPKYGRLSLVSFMYYFFYELLAPFIELLGLCLIVLGILTGILNWQFVLTITMVYSIFSILQTLIFFAGRYLIQNYTYYKRDSLQALIISISDLFFFRPFLLFVRLYATFTYKKYLHSWNKITREAFD